MDELCELDYVLTPGDGAVWCEADDPGGGRVDLYAQIDGDILCEPMDVMSLGGNNMGDDDSMLDDFAMDDRGVVWDEAVHCIGGAPDDGYEGASTSSEGGHESHHPIEQLLVDVHDDADTSPGCLVPTTLKEKIVQSIFSKLLSETKYASSSQQASQMTIAMERRALDNEVAQRVTEMCMVIDDGALLEALSARFVSSEKYTELITKAVELVRAVGFEHTMRLILTPYTFVADNDGLANFVMLVNERAPALHITGLMPNYGAGRAVYRQFESLRGSNARGVISTATAKEIVDKLVTPASTCSTFAGGPVHVVDLSSHKSEYELLAMRKFYGALGIAVAEYSNDFFVPLRYMDECLSECSSTDACSAEDAYRDVRRAIENARADEANAHELVRRMSRFVSMAKTRTSLGFYDWSRTTAVVCDNYAQGTTDALLASVRHGIIETMGDLVQSDAHLNALLHGEIVRKAVLARVVALAEEHAHSVERHEAKVRFAPFNASEDLGQCTQPWEFYVNIVGEVDIEHKYCHARRVLDSSEWKQYTQDEFMQKWNGKSVMAMHRDRVANDSYTDYVLVFNGVTDIRINDTEYLPSIEAFAKKPFPHKEGFTIDMGGPIGMAMLSFARTPPSTCRGLPIGCSSIADDHAWWIAGANEKRIAECERLVGSSGRIHDHEIYPICPSAFSGDAIIDQYFPRRTPQNKTMSRMCSLLRSQFMSACSLDYMKPVQEFATVYRWVSCIDPLLLSFRQRLDIADPLKTITIDTHHTRQLAEFFARLATYFRSAEPRDEQHMHLTKLVTIEETPHGTERYVVNITPDLARRLLAEP